MQRTGKGVVMTAALLAASLSLVSLGRSETLREGDEQSRFQFVARLQGLAQLAVSENPTEAEAAIQALREAGPEGLDALIKVHEQLLQRALKLSPTERAGHPEWKRLKYALDKTGAQCDNWASKLFWHTDLEKAKAQAKKENKPILSLRLLGNLDDELSCANSRFFRTALYPNAQINKVLRDNFILHWQSVRPVPKVTIDFGDGRKIQTTITGNSIHYALDSKGRVLDALPGLNGPGAFERWLDYMAALHLGMNQSNQEQTSFEEYSRKWHQARLNDSTRIWQADIGRLKMAKTFDIPENAWVAVRPASGTPSPSQTGVQINAQAAMPPRANAPSDEELMHVTARLANRNAVAKAAMVETRILKEITIPLPRDRNALQRTTTDELWSKIAALHETDAKLDENSLKVLRAKSLHPDKAAFAFEKSVAEDTVRNEYLRHGVIHQWLMKNPNYDLDELNKRVYAEMFLTPDSDPWLGLLPTEAYTAIQNDGVVGAHQ